MDVKLPDGTVIQGVPDGTTKADLVAKLQKNGMAVPSEWLAASPPAAPERSFAQRAGDALRDIPRQVGLTARYGLEGVGQAADLVTEPVAGLMRAAGVPTKSTGQLATGLANAVGLPQPRTSGERVIGDAARMVAGAAGMGGAGALGASIARPAASAGLAGRGISQAAGAEAAENFVNRFASSVGNRDGIGLMRDMLRANPMVQAGSAAGSGLAGGAVRESGGSEGEQMLGAVLGGLAGAAVPGVAARAGRAIQGTPGKLADLVNPGRNVPQKPLDIQITAKLDGSGVDWALIPEKVKQSVRQDVEKALKLGDDLDPKALRRMVDFRTVGATPTRGTVTLDPIQITREKNLAKTGANSSMESAQQLTNIESSNNQALIKYINDMGAEKGGAAIETGEKGVASLSGWLEGKKANINRLYQAARDSEGRSMPLDGAGFTREASALLDENLLGHALPKDVELHLNRIAMGKVPFDVDYAEQLKTRIGNLQRGASDGSTRMALGMVRRALDNATPASGVPAASGIPNPGNLPAVRTPNALMPMEDGAIAAFNRARGANREMMQQIEKVPALEKLWKGDIAPDDFLNRYVISPGAKVRDVSEMINVMGPGGKEAMRDGVLGSLKSAAVGTSMDEAAKFSASGFRKALDKLGDRKLALLFSKEEVAQLKALSRVADYTTVQPSGSAVWNSNTPAGLVGKAVDAMQLLGRVPGFGTLSNLGADGLKVAVRTSQQNAAVNAIPGLVRQPVQSQTTPLRRLAAPAGMSSALFAAPLSPNREDDQ